MDILKGRTLVLASKSPRRDEILTIAGLEHKILAGDCDESVIEYRKGYAGEYVKELSKMKADCVLDEIFSVYGEDSIVLSADTIVVSKEGEALGKPKDRDDAYRMLNSLSGTKHAVITGYTIVNGKNGEKISGYVKSDIEFRELSDEEIYSYIDDEKPYDKAGAYGIQERACVFVKSIDGDYFNIMGLPVAQIYADLLNIL